jgi:hypothetical protein|tara:strand:+ start:850 stop:1065 length:216 start_codon:yes stop_codon:yes gene_type:complete
MHDHVQLRLRTGLELKAIPASSTGIAVVSDGSVYDDPSQRQDCERDQFRGDHMVLFPYGVVWCGVVVKGRR